MEDWALAGRLQNKCLSNIKKAKCDFVNGESNNNINDSKKIWRNINEIWLNKNSNTSKITLIDHDTNEEIRQEDTAEYIIFSQILAHRWPKI